MERIFDNTIVEHLNEYRYNTIKGSQHGLTRCRLCFDRSVRIPWRGLWAHRWRKVNRCNLSRFWKGVWQGNL